MVRRSNGSQTKKKKKPAINKDEIFISSYTLGMPSTAAYYVALITCWIYVKMRKMFDNRGKVHVVANIKNTSEYIVQNA